MTNTAEIKAALRTQHAPRMLNLTPTWAGIMPALIAAIQNGTSEGEAMARTELMRLAEMTDAANARASQQQLADAEAHEQPQKD